MKRLDLILRARSLTRDLSNSFFREDDLVNYINEGIDRIGQIIPELRPMPYLTNANQEVTYLPKEWQHLLAVYCASRLCTQDERHYQAATFMNEFETKLMDLSADVVSGKTTILDQDGHPVEVPVNHEYVTNNYYLKPSGSFPRGRSLE